MLATSSKGAFQARRANLARDVPVYILANLAASLKRLDRRRCMVATALAHAA